MTQRSQQRSKMRFRRIPAMKINILLILLLLSSLAAAQNTAPVFVPQADTSVTEGGEIQFLLTATDDDGDPLIYLTVEDAPADIILTDYGDGTALFEYYPDFNEAGDYPMVFSVTDDIETTTMTVNLTVYDSNPPPYFVDPQADTNVTEGDTLALRIAAADPDGFFPSLSIVDSTLPVNAIFVDSSSGIGGFEFYPNYVQAGVYELIFKALDSENATEDTVEVTVDEAGNQPPILILPETLSYIAVEGVEIVILSEAVDPDSTVPSLSATTPLPDNAVFTDSLNGRGTLSFTPDISQIGDYIFELYANDETLADTIEISISVVGPNVPPTWDPINDRIVNEGNYVGLSVSATDENGTIPILTADFLSNATFVDNGNGTGQFDFYPDYTQAGFYDVSFYAYDGLYADTAIVNIEVKEAGNQPPTFASTVTDTTMAEGESLELLIQAADPEGAPVQLFFCTSYPNSSLVDSGNGRGSLIFNPDMTQGGDTYDFVICAADSILGATEIDTGEVAIMVEVTQVNSPPILSIVSSTALFEGRWYIDTLSATDPEGDVLSFDLYIDPEDTLGSKAQLYLKSISDTEVEFGFYPEFNYTDGSTLTSWITFYVEDLYDSDSQRVSFDIMDVAGDNSDPGLKPDTITWLGVTWKGDNSGFSVTSRIWHDSILVGALTGFKWTEDWLECDSIIYGSYLDTVPTISPYINNDSLMILAGFLFPSDNRYFEAGEFEYFTAFFSPDDTWDPADWTEIGSILFDSAKVGSSGDFVFDYRIRDKIDKGLLEELRSLSPQTANTYVPIVSMREVRQTRDSVAISFFDDYNDKQLITGDTMFVGIDDTGLARSYHIQVYIENDTLITGFQTGWRLYSPDGVEWSWADQPNGIGSSGQVALGTARRFGPLANLFDVTGGITVDEMSLDGLTADTMILTGTASNPGGMPPGLNDYMISLHFTPADLPDEEVRTLCIDTVSGYWNFTRADAVDVYPGYSGALCFPVKYVIPAAADDDNPLPYTFSLAQNYPNPFNPITNIKFTLGRSSHVNLAVYNILGQIVRQLTDEELTAGEHMVLWDGTDQQNRQVASGIYFYRLKTDHYTQSRKMILVK